jgi:hypothetical protein
MRLSRLVCLAVVSLISSQISAQVRCNTDEFYHQNQKNVDENVKNIIQMEKSYQDFVNNQQKHGKTNGVKYTIPVVFHLIHMVGDTTIGWGANLKAERIYQQIEILNNDYRKIQGSRGDGTGVDT